MSNLSNVLSVGRLYCDVIFTGLPRLPTPGTEVFADGVGLHAGGGAAITAGHLAALGHKTSLAAYLPPAPFLNRVVGELQGLGVDLTLCQTSDGGDAPQMTVALAHGDERAFVTHRAGPAFPPFAPDTLRDAGITHVHIGEAATLNDAPQLVEIARAAGASLSLDCSWDDDLDAGKIAGLLPEIDVFLPNSAEVRLLRDLGVPEPFAKLTVIKEGKDGATALCSDGTETHAHAKAVEVVDTTGAGDAFNAAFLNAWLQRKPIADCVDAGNAKGAEAVGYRGGLGGLVPRGAGKT